MGNAKVLLLNGDIDQTRFNCPFLAQVTCTVDRTPILYWHYNTLTTANIRTTYWVHPPGIQRNPQSKQRLQTQFEMILIYSAGAINRNDGPRFILEAEHYYVEWILDWNGTLWYYNWKCASTVHIYGSGSHGIAQWRWAVCLQLLSGILNP